MCDFVLFYFIELIKIDFDHFNWAILAHSAHYIRLTVYDYEPLICRLRWFIFQVHLPLIKD